MANVSTSRGHSPANVLPVLQAMGLNVKMWTSVQRNSIIVPTRLHAQTELAHSPVTAMTGMLAMGVFVLILTSVKSRGLVQRKAYVRIQKVVTNVPVLTVSSTSMACATTLMNVTLIRRSVIVTPLVPTLLAVTSALVKLVSQVMDSPVLMPTSVLPTTNARKMQHAQTMLAVLPVPVILVLMAMANTVLTLTSVSAVHVTKMLFV